jgi:hypothetical protein
VKKNVHAIVVGSINGDAGGRPMGLYRLRTVAESHGFSTEVIDFSWCVTEDQMLEFCKHCIGDNTLVFGISTIWWKGIDETRSDSDSMTKTYTWACSSFFEKFKQLYPHVKIVIGCSKYVPSLGAFDLEQFLDWKIEGFADESFPELLKHLSKKPNNLKYTLLGNKQYAVDSNTNHSVTDLSLIETVWEKGDMWRAHQPIPIELSRGCIFKCAFCTHPFLGKKTFEYIRSTEGIATELKRNYELFGTYRYQIADDTLNDSMEKLDRLHRAIDLAKLPKFEFVAYIRPETIVTNPEMIPKLKELGIVGGYCGIESLNMPARRAIGKGMDINRVTDTLRKLVSESKVLLHASLILGLPGDTHDDPNKWLEFLTENKNNLFASWGMHVLGISGSGTSLIEKYPAKYGYTLGVFDKDFGFYQWRSPTMSSFAAGPLVKNFNQKSSKVLGIGGWGVSSSWYANESNEEIRTSTTRELDVYKKCTIISLARRDTKLNIIRNSIND